MFVTCQDMCPSQHPQHQHCDASRDLRQTIELTEKILHVLPQVDSLEAHLGIWWQALRAHTWPDTPHNPELIRTLDEFIAVKRVTRVDVYRAKEACLDTTVLIDKAKWFASWTPATSWQAIQTLEPEIERVIDAATIAQDSIGGLGPDSSQEDVQDTATAGGAATEPAPSDEAGPVADLGSARD